MPGIYPAGDLAAARAAPRFRLKLMAGQRLRSDARRWLWQSMFRPKDWVRDQVELYERSGGTEGTTLRDTGLPVIIVTHVGNKTGAIRKTPLMRVKNGNSYVL